MGTRSICARSCAIWVEAIQQILGFGLAAWLMLDHISHAGETGGALLLVYWALNLPVLGEEIIQFARLYPTYRNITLRLLERLAPSKMKARSPSRRGRPYLRMLFRVRLRVNLRALSEPTESPSRWQTSVCTPGGTPFWRQST